MIIHFHASSCTTVVLNLLCPTTPPEFSEHLHDPTSCPVKIEKIIENTYKTATAALLKNQIIRQQTIEKRVDYISMRALKLLSSQQTTEPWDIAREATPHVAINHESVSSFRLHS